MSQRWEISLVGEWVDEEDGEREPAERHVLTSGHYQGVYDMCMESLLKRVRERESQP